MKKILVVEDRQEYAQIVQELCRGIFDVATASNLSDALYLMGSGVDAVITDIHFPREEGGREEWQCGVAVAEQCKKRGIPYQMALGHHGENFSGEYLRTLFRDIGARGLTGDSYEYTGRIQSLQKYGVSVKGTEAVTLAYIAKGYAEQWMTVLGRVAVSLGMDPFDIFRRIIQNMENPSLGLGSGDDAVRATPAQRAKKLVERLRQDNALLSA